MTSNMKLILLFDVFVDFPPPLQVLLTHVQHGFTLWYKGIEEVVARYAYARQKPDLTRRLLIRLIPVHHRYGFPAGSPFGVPLLIELLENHLYSLHLDVPRFGTSTQVTSGHGDGLDQAPVFGI